MISVLKVLSDVILWPVHHASDEYHEMLSKTRLVSIVIPNTGILRGKAAKVWYKEHLS